MKYTKVANDAFEHIQLNAGILTDDFDPATETIGNILGVTGGGISFNSNPEYQDFGEGMDNVPANTMELKKLTSMNPVLSGTFMTVTADLVKLLVGASDITEESGVSKIVPRADLLTTDFKDIWFIGDYSNVNDGIGAGYIALHLKNGLSTGGFQIQTNDKDKGNFAMEITGHYTMTDTTILPFDVYVKEGYAIGVKLDKSTATVAAEGTTTLTATTHPEDATVVWLTSDDDVATVSNGVVTGVAAGTATITAKITVDKVEYTATCEVTVTA